MKKASQKSAVLGINDLINVVFWVRSVYGVQVHGTKIAFFYFWVLGRDFLHEIFVMYC